jgi:hypothetical protein
MGTKRLRTDHQNMPYCKEFKNKKRDLQVFCFRESLNTSTPTTFKKPNILISEFFYLPTDAEENCFKKNIKIYIKTAPTCFGLITTIRERTIRAC